MATPETQNPGPAATAPVRRGVVQPAPPTTHGPWDLFEGALSRSRTIAPEFFSGDETAARPMPDSRWPAEPQPEHLFALIALDTTFRLPAFQDRIAASALSPSELHAFECKMQERYLAALYRSPFVDPEHRLYTVESFLASAKIDTHFANLIVPLYDQSVTEAAEVALSGERFVFEIHLVGEGEPPRERQALRSARGLIDASWVASGRNVLKVVLAEESMRLLDRLVMTDPALFVSRGVGVGSMGVEAVRKTIAFGTTVRRSNLDAREVSSEFRLLKNCQWVRSVKMKFAGAPHDISVSAIPSGSTYVRTESVSRTMTQVADDIGKYIVPWGGDITTSWYDRFKEVFELSAADVALKAIPEAATHHPASNTDVRFTTFRGTWYDVGITGTDDTFDGLEVEVRAWTANGWTETYALKVTGRLSNGMTIAFAIGDSKWQHQLPRLDREYGPFEPREAAQFTKTPIDGGLGVVLAGSGA